MYSLTFQLPSNIYHGTPEHEAGCKKIFLAWKNRQHAPDFLLPISILPYNLLIFLITLYLPHSAQINQVTFSIILCFSCLYYFSKIAWCLDNIKHECNVFCSFYICNVSYSTIRIFFNYFMIFYWHGSVYYITKGISDNCY